MILDLSFIQHIKQEKYLLVLLYRRRKNAQDSRKTMKRGMNMPRIRPDFTKSPYFVDEPGNWHLKPGAPEHLHSELKNYLRSLEVADEIGTINGNHIEYPYGDHKTFQ